MDGSWFQLIGCMAGIIIPILVCGIFKIIDFLSQFKDFELEREINNTPKPRKVSKKRFKKFVMNLLDYYLEKSRWCGKYEK